MTIRGHRPSPLTTLSTRCALALHRRVFWGEFAFVRNFAGANKLSDNCYVMPGPAQMQLVTQLQVRENLGTVKLCTISQSVQFDLLARQNSHLSFDRLLLPILITGNWHHQPPWDVAMSENEVHFIFFSRRHEYLDIKNGHYTAHRAVVRSVSSY